MSLATITDLTVSHLINPVVRRRFQLICYGLISQGFTVFGIGTNILNIICFVKQGFKESINISLLGLAISDLGCQIPLLWTNFTFVQKFQELDLPFHASDTAYLISGIPHFTFTRITAVITAFITLERCVCITMPLKVASIFTQRRIATINTCIYIVLILAAFPIYATSKIEFQKLPERNRTILGLAFTEGRLNAEKFFFGFQGVLVPFTSLSVITVCMVTMVTTLRKQVKWRQTQRATRKLDSSSERDRKLVKMIVIISTLFVTCFFPSVVLLLMLALEPGFNYGGKYFDVTVFVYGVCNIAETVNSSMNILIYYKMSSRYRNHCRQILCGIKGNNHAIV